MKVCLFTILSICSALSAFGQKSIGIKLYQNTDFFETKYHHSWNTVTTVRNVNFTRFSLALSLHTRKNYVHELEVLVPEISKSLDDIQYPMSYDFRIHPSIQSSGSTYSLRYEINRTLTNQAERFQFNLGAALNPYYVFFEHIPHETNVYYSSTRQYGFAFNIVPRMTYKLGQRFSLDLNVPLKLYDLRVTETEIHNPAIPVRQQNNTEYNNLFFESAYTIRFGVMYAFGQ